MPTRIRRAIVDDTHKLIYVEIAKAACSSIKFAIGESLGMPEPAIDDWLCGAVPDVNLGDERYRGHFKFTFVRNPWDRAVSCYVEKFYDPLPGSDFAEQWANPLARALGKDHVSFEDFLEHIGGQSDDVSDIHWKSQYTTAFDDSGQPVCDFVGRFEQLDRDFAEVCRTVGIATQLPHKNRLLHRKPYREYYNDDLRQLVERRYANDIRAFNYSF